MESHTDVSTLNKLGGVYESSNRLQEAIGCYTTCLKYTPNNLILLNQIGVCYFKMTQYKQAVTMFNKVIQIKQIGDVHRNISTCYVNLKSYKKAEKHAVLAYNLEPWKAENNTSLASLYYILKRYDQSITMYKKLNKEDIYDMSFPYLGKRDFKMGFHYYEHRLNKNSLNPQTHLCERVDIPQIRLWKGEDCRRLLLIYEQGIGDNIQYFRFILQLARQYPSMQIDYFCKQNVSLLFDYALSNLRILTDINITDYDYKTYIMSIPYLLKLDNITPNVDAYIKKDPEKWIEWQQRLKPLQKFRIGFTYNGLLTSFIEKYIPLSAFLELCDLDIELICIHKKSDIQMDIAALKPTSNLHFFDIDETPFVDTIHILQNIDLLITIDTFIVHLAGILNVKTWLLLGKYSEWRWSDCDTCYWYRSVELIRNIEEVLEQIIPVVKNKLKQHLTNLK